MATILRRLDHALVSLRAELWQADLPDGSDLTDTTRRFAADLVADRLSIESPPSWDDASAVDHNGQLDAVGDAWVARVLVAAMLTTNLYFTLRALDPSAAMHRTGHNEEATEPTDTTALWANRQLATRVVATLAALEQELVGIAVGPGTFAKRVLQGRNARDLEAVTERFLASFRVVINTIRHTLAPGGGDTPRLARSDVRALTELAWFCVSTFADDAYPGWHDLLLELSHYDEPEYGRVGRPSFDNIVDAGDAIRARYLRLTSQSWAAQGDTVTKLSARVHVAVAELLLAQSAVREALPPGSLQAPLPAVAHITSFDLELEMALLRMGHPFYILFPVHIVDTKNNLLHLRWCLLTVSGNDIESVIRPDAEAFQMLQGVSRELAKLPGPIVVRLSGCPLIELPPLGVNGTLTPLGEQVLGSAGAGAMGHKPGDREIVWEFDTGVLRADRDATPADVSNLRNRLITIRHAVVVSEHDAMLHNAMDSQPWLEHESLARRLPFETVVDHPGWRRFWMLLGVQVSDHAIRQRVSHVVAWYPSLDKRPGETRSRSRREPDNGRGKEKTEGESSSEAAPVDLRLGVLVSRHVGQIEQDLLYWNRFAIVENSDAHLFAEDLRHVAELHLRPEDGGQMIRCVDA